MANWQVRGRGIIPKEYLGMDYCTKCSLWGEKQVAITLLGSKVYTFLHWEYIAGYKFNTSRCYCEVVPV